MPSSTGTRALSRGLQLIDILAERQDGFPLSQIARKASLSKSSTHRLLQTLTREGYVAQDGETTHYRLSLKLLWLANSLVDGLGLDRLAQPHLEELAQATGQTIHMALLDGNAAVYIQKIDTPGSIRMYSQVGRKVPFHCTGLGKAILAHLPPERIQEIFTAEGLPPHTANTFTEPESLLEHLSLIRAQGYALDEEEHERGICCIAAPLFNHLNRVAGAVSITALSFRVDRQTLVSWHPALQDCAEKLTLILEHALPWTPA